MLEVDDRLGSIRAQLDTLARSPDGHDETTVDIGLRYGPADPVRVRVRRRDRRYDLDDDATAVTLAGRPAGWLTRIEDLVAAEGFNVNRRGVLFVPVVHGRDIAALVLRLGAVSRTAYLTLLEDRDG
jgi:hypothetical protein